MRLLRRANFARRGRMGLALLVAVMLSATASRADIISTFDTGDDGWTVVDLEFQNYTNVLGGPSTPVFNPAGHIEATDMSNNEFFFQAPSAYLGDLGGFYGGALSYDQFSTPLDPSFRGDPDVLLIGAGMVIGFQGATNPGTSFTSFVVPMTEAGWTKNVVGGPAVTRDEFLAVLANLTALRIRGEYLAGVLETTGMDNVRLAAVPEPASIALFGPTAVALVLIARVRRHRD